MFYEILRKLGQVTGIMTERERERIPNKKSTFVTIISMNGNQETSSPGIKRLTAL